MTQTVRVDYVNKDGHGRSDVHKDVEVCMLEHGTLILKREHGFIVKVYSVGTNFTLEDVPHD